VSGRAVVVAWAQVGAGAGGPVDGHFDAPFNSLLDDAERDRAERYRLPRDRAQFVVGAALTRAAGAILLEAPGTAADVRIDRTCSRCGGAHGVPRLVDAPWARLSVTHAGGMVGVAVGVGARFGLDVEPIRDPPDAALLTATSTSRERAMVAASPSPAREFARLWTRKESLLKALGTGLDTPPETVDVAGDVPPLVSGRWLTLTGPGDAFGSALFAAAESGGYTAGRAFPAVALAEFRVDAGHDLAVNSAWTTAVAALNADR
jgi:4'-phosphopantetheinyl transferase